MKGYIIMAVLIGNRKENAIAVQDLLTKHGCIIKIRLGLHETANVCAEDGLILLQLEGEKQEIKSLEESLNLLNGVKTKLIKLSSE